MHWWCTAVQRMQCRLHTYVIIAVVFVVQCDAMWCDALTRNYLIRRQSVGRSVGLWWWWYLTTMKSISIIQRPSPSSSRLAIVSCIIINVRRVWNKFEISNSSSIRLMAAVACSHCAVRFVSQFSIAVDRLLYKDISSLMEIRCWNSSIIDAFFFMNFAITSAVI